MEIFFIYLTAFKQHGGIEKFNKAFIKALGLSFKKTAVSSAYDQSPNTAYLSDNQVFRGYGGSRLRFVANTVRQALKCKVLVVGHVNLAIIGLVVKQLKPGLPLVVIAHGIDVWGRLPLLKKKLLEKADLILSVSSFTKAKLNADHGIPENRIGVFPNTLDPFFRLPDGFDKPAYLLERYRLSADRRVLLSICRLSAKEAYKGYDIVIKALPAVVSRFPDVKYVIVGKYDSIEHKRIMELAKARGVEDNLLLTGFVPDEELTDHYLLGDAFVMPSRNEGFGIVYIEAMACGLPVIAGNADGSVDALDGGRLGALVDPLDSTAIATALIQSLSEEWNHKKKKELQKKVIDKFGFEKFKVRLKEIFDQQEK